MTCGRSLLPYRLAKPKQSRSALYDFASTYFFPKTIPAKCRCGISLLDHWVQGSPMPPRAQRKISS
jgi:hypothetical protein